MTATVDALSSRNCDSDRPRRPHITSRLPVGSARPRSAPGGLDLGNPPTRRLRGSRGRPRTVHAPPTGRPPPFRREPQHVGSRNGRRAARRLTSGLDVRVDAPATDASYGRCPMPTRRITVRRTIKVEVRREVRWRATVTPQYQSFLAPPRSVSEIPGTTQRTRQVISTSGGGGGLDGPLRRAAKPGSRVGRIHLVRERGQADRGSPRAGAAGARGRAVVRRNRADDGHGAAQEHRPRARAQQVRRCVHVAHVLQEGVAAARAGRAHRAPGSRTPARAPYLARRVARRRARLQPGACRHHRRQVVGLDHRGDRRGDRALLPL